FQNSDFVFKQLKPGIFLFAMTLRKSQNLVKAGGQRYIFLQGRLASSKDCEPFENAIERLQE
ncbi:MAG: hypothetical protein ACI4DK_12985, partial [Lachnospiraceae bacterium]